MVKVPRLRPGAATNQNLCVDTTGEVYRRTATGYGRTKKPGLHGTVKNPRLLKACMIISVISCMSEFFDISLQNQKNNKCFYLVGQRK
jgi:hypothetical protein